MQPSNVKSWDDFEARKLRAAEAPDPEAVIEAAFHDAPARSNRRFNPRASQEKRDAKLQSDHSSKRRPAAIAAPATLADALKAAVALAIARHGRAPREIAVREETLLDVLIEAIRRPS